MRESSNAFAGVVVLLACTAAVAAPPPPKGGAAQQTATGKAAEPPAWKYGVAHPGFQFTLDETAADKPKTGKHKTDQDKVEIFCGVLYPPTTNNALFFVNNTNRTLPPGTKVRWVLQGENIYGKPHPFKGTTTPSPSAWPPNPPTTEYWPTGPLHQVHPPQKWDRPCKAWAILP